MDARVVVVMAAVLVGSVAAAAEMPGNVKDPQAVEEVLSGKRAIANAAWWGFNEEDSTDALQAAINSGAERVIVPNMTKDWIVRPITLASDQELVLEEGVVITAKRGEYRGKGDSVLTARDVSNLVIRGYGATIRMQKEDYIMGAVLDAMGWDRWLFGRYEKAESRMVLSLRGCTNVKVYGLTLRDSGGDGIYVDGSGKQAYSKNVLIKDVLCDNNYRQGISVISADGLLVEDCVFQNTWGTPPCAGVDIEPDSAKNVTRNIVFRNCLFQDNYGTGIEVILSNLSDESSEILIRFENCRVTSKWGRGIRVSHAGETGPGGLIEFRDCVVENTEGWGLLLRQKSGGPTRMRFLNCTVRNVANNRNIQDAVEAPVSLSLRIPERPTKLGSVDFVNCVVEDDQDRPAVLVWGEVLSRGLFDVTGTITVRNPHGVKYDLGEKQTGVTLAIKQAER